MYHVTKMHVPWVLQYNARRSVFARDEGFSIRLHCTVRNLFRLPSTGEICRTSFRLPIYIQSKYSLTVMLSQKCSEQPLPFRFLQFLFHHQLRYNRVSIGCHPNFNPFGVGISWIGVRGICSLQSCCFDVIQELACHLYHQCFILLYKVAARNPKIV